MCSVELLKENENPSKIVTVLDIYKSYSHLTLAKKVLGHYIQADVKFISLRNFEGNRVRFFQYTAIDDVTRIRAMKIYLRYN